MKNKFIKIATITTIFAFGVGLLATKNSAPVQLNAVAHVDNYADYTYSGSYYSFLTSNISQYTEGLNGTLRKSLSSNILPKGWYGYSGSNSTQLGGVLQSADEDPTNSDNMVLFYTRDSISKRGAGSGTGNWNREHVWPRSLSSDNWSSSNGGSVHAGTDILHVRPTWYDTNEARGSIRYGDNGKKGVQKYNGIEYAYISGSYFEPIDTVKGDVARILMYVWTAYYDYYKDDSLLITNAIESYDVLLKWHTLDKPDVLEGNRNDFSESSKQKNRNPFVDHPEYAWKIFGDSASESVKNSCKAAYPDGGSTVPPGPSSSSSSTPSSSELPSSTSSVVSSSVESTSTSTIISSSEEISSSVEISVSSSEETTIHGSSNIEESSENNDGDKKKKNAGCNGSLVIIPVGSLSALIGLVFVFSKKKK